MQRITPAQPAALEGIGLFSARASRITIHPATTPVGIVFEIDGHSIPAHIDALSERPPHPAFAHLKPRCTTLSDEHRSVATVEHILSALAGLGITDARIQIEGDTPHTEIPILDGSAQPFARAVLSAGQRTLEDPIEPLRVREPIRVESGDASILIEPSDTPNYIPSYTYNIDYPGTPIGKASARWSGDPQQYARSVAPARTFCLEHEAQQMHATGLFTHLTPRDMLVIDDKGPIDNDYRLPDECARHKLLDLIGDLALVGAPLCAKITATRSGHALAHQAARAIVDQQTPSYEPRP